MIRLEAIQRRTQENPALTQLSLDEMARARAIFELGVADWFNYSPRERRIFLLATQTIHHRDRSVAPIIRIDSQLIPNQTQVTVLFKREDGPIEVSRFKMLEAFRTDEAAIVLADLELQGFETGIRAPVEQERVLRAA